MVTDLHSHIPMVKEEVEAVNDMDQRVCVELYDKIADEVTTFQDPA